MEKTKKKKNRWKSFLQDLGLYTLSDIVRITKESREHGYKEGYDEGYRSAMEQKIKRSEALTPEEEEALIKVFVNFGLEICYDPYLGGLRIRKRDRIITKQNNNDSKTISKETSSNRSSSI